MGFVKFVMWFIVGLIGVLALETFIDNSFVTAFVVAAIVGILGAKD